VGLALTAALTVSVAAGWIWSVADEGTGSVSIDRDPADRTTLGPATIGTNAVLGGAPFPDAAVSALDGTEVSTADLVGRPLVVNIWGSTCGPCRRELPDLAAAHAAYGDRVRFVGISYLGASEREEAFARERGVNYELYYDTDGEFITAAGVAAFPVTLFITADGTVVEQTGVLDETRLSRLIEDTLL
jgi:thiol-disulfide isomerase/thioredoxin